jgi:hypothetical protein
MSQLLLLRMKDIVLKRQQIPPMRKQNLSTGAARPWEQEESAWRLALETDRAQNHQSPALNFCSNLVTRELSGWKAETCFYGPHRDAQ